MPGAVDNGAAQTPHTTAQHSPVGGVIPCVTLRYPAFLGDPAGSSVEREGFACDIWEWVEGAPRSTSRIPGTACFPSPLTFTSTATPSPAQRVPAPKCFLTCCGGQGAPGSWVPLRAAHPPHSSPLALPVGLRVPSQQHHPKQAALHGPALLPAVEMHCSG